MVEIRTNNDAKMKSLSRLQLCSHNGILRKPFRRQETDMDANAMKSLEPTSLSITSKVTRAHSGRSTVNVNTLFHIGLNPLSSITSVDYKEQLSELIELVSE